ncbi:MAG: hypothetical protein IPP15_03530 [Saprospiraceae bacterium]|uniref:Uncharacterized protein n=1 Tax=Candidatus Opimibacter skivensis TaxID=2982028 RepID=A0A9D7XLV2_9BACT|nr:hypothetical protein [Candidatus Opimibacter skivensis]
MKKTILFIPSFIILFLSAIVPLRASHLDGLWRNERLRITLRVEQDQDGFRAKRTDEGIWYHYITDDNRYFTDKRGNWYELIDDDQLVWNDVKSDKRINFNRVNNRDYNQFDNRGIIYNSYGNSYDRSTQNDWYNNSYVDRTDYLEGNWYQRNGRGNLQIETFHGGIRVKTEHRGWEKFYGDLSGSRFRDDDGDTIILLDDETLRFRNDHGKCEEIYTRHRHWDRDGHYWRD